MPKWRFGGFLDITRLVGLVIASNLVQTDPNTCSELFTVLLAVMTYDITHKMRKSNGHHAKMAILVPFWLFFGPKSTCRARYCFKLGPDCF